MKNERGVFHMRICKRDSWFDPASSRRLSAELAEALTQRCQGQDGVFLTLTYDRTEFEDARQCYRASVDDRHVRRFMEQLGKCLDQKLAGRWLCKLEFQRGGWVHWHIILLGVKFIDHRILSECWGWGHTWIKRLTTKRIKYCCKYVSKGGGVPAWVLLEPIRSVKVIRVSPGFWGQGDITPSSDEDEEEVQRFRVPAYVPIGMMVERAKHRTEVKDERGRWRTLNAACWDLVQRALDSGAQLVNAGSRWISVEGLTWEQLHAWSRHAPGVAAGREAAEPPTSLERNRTSATGRTDDVWSWWFVEAIRQLLSWHNGERWEEAVCPSA